MSHIPGLLHGSCATRILRKLCPQKASRILQTMAQPSFSILWMEPPMEKPGIKLCACSISTTIRAIQGHSGFAAGCVKFVGG